MSLCFSHRLLPTFSPRGSNSRLASRIATIPETGVRSFIILIGKSSARLWVSKSVYLEHPTEATTVDKTLHREHALLLAAVTELLDRLENCADEYATKSLVITELVAYIHTLPKRSEDSASVPTLCGVSVDAQQQTMRYGSRSVTLAPAELKIMQTLLKDGRTVRHATLRRSAWGRGEAVTPNAFEVTVHRLRKKLIAIGATVRIVNVRGVGFSLQTLSNQSS